MERLIINEFKKQFKWRKDHGNEYFEGNYADMIDIIYNMIKKYDGLNSTNSDTIIEDSKNVFIYTVKSYKGWCNINNIDVIITSEKCDGYILRNYSTEPWKIKCQYNTLHSIILQLISEKNKDPVKNTNDIFISSNL